MFRTRTNTLAAFAFMATIGNTLHAQDGCGWGEAFNANGLFTPARSIIEYDDGQGPQVYFALGGVGAEIQSFQSGLIVRWDGQNFTQVGPTSTYIPPYYGPVQGYINAMAVYDLDGPGPQPSSLIVGGAIWDYIDGEVDYRWNGDTTGPFHVLAYNSEQKWFSVGQFGLGGGFYADQLIPGTSVGSVEVKCMTVFDDGTGPALYVGGQFKWISGADEYAPTIEANGIAKWTGTQWVNPIPLMQRGPYRPVYSLHVHDEDGDGPARPALFVGGLDVHGLSRWDGTTLTHITGPWAPIGESPIATETFDLDGPGGNPPALMIGGLFSGLPSSLYSWNGSAISPISGAPSHIGAVSMHVYNGSLYLSSYPYSTDGSFDYCSLHDQRRHMLTRFDGTTFSTLGNGTTSGPQDIEISLACLNAANSRAMATVHLNGQEVLAYSHESMRMGDDMSPNLGFWNGTTHVPMYPASQTKGIYSFWAYDRLKSLDPDGSGPAPTSLFVYGQPWAAGNTSVNFIARYDGSQWYDEGTGVFANSFEDYVQFLDAHDDGSGTKLFAAGSGQTAPFADDHARRVKRKDATGWAEIGSFNTSAFLDAGTFDEDGSGPLPPAYYVRMYESTLLPGGGSSSLQAKWDGTSWSDGSFGLSLPVIPFWFDDGSGAAMYAGGSVHFAPQHGLDSDGNGSADNILAKKTTAGWTYFGGLPTFIRPDQSHARIKVWNDGTGPAIYAYGFFNAIGGVPVNAVAKWTGSTWEQLGGGLSSGAGDTFVTTIAEYDAGSEHYLVVMGNFTHADGLPATGIAAWNGSTWFPLQLQDELNVGQLSYESAAQFASGSSNNLYITIGGTAMVNGVRSVGIVKWSCAPACPADFNNSGSVSVQDIFDFLAAWFAGTPTADINHVGGVTVQDIFDYLAAWFSGC